LPRNREGDHKAAALTDEANRRKHGTWNECLYQFLLLSSKQSMTVPVALAQFLNSDNVLELHDGDRDSSMRCRRSPSITHAFRRR